MLLVVGLASPAFIATHRRLGAFDITDYARLTQLIAPFGEIVFTPNVLTEISNLMRSTPKTHYARLAQVFGTVIGQAAETYVASREASRRTEFAALGLTDATILQSLDRDTVLLTTDLDLYLAALKAGHQVQNYNHLRDI